MKPLRWGIKTAQHHTTYNEILDVWHAVDRNPTFEHAWIFDHFAPIQGSLDGPCLEGWTLLAALAAETERVQLGMMVVGNTYRHPAVNAHMAATVDVISNGRLQFGIGAGWNEYEHQSMGIPLYQPGERIRRLGEACEITQRLFTEDQVTFDGRYYQLTDARLNPKPVQKPWPPFVIGGGGEQLTLRVVARYADIWNGHVENPDTDIDTLRHKIEVLHGHCAEFGRDPNEIEISVQTRINYDDLDSTVRTLQAAVDAGATHLILMLANPYPAAIVDRLAEEVISRVHI